jgi:hypothetical protein
MRPLFAICTLLLVWSAGAFARWDDFGVYYPHTRWVDQETHSITIDAFTTRLVISERGKQPVIVRGNWRGRGFWRVSDLHGEFPYFAIAHEGVDAGVFKEPRLEKYNFKRVRPDPKT